MRASLTFVFEVQSIAFYRPGGTWSHMKAWCDMGDRFSKKLIWVLHMFICDTITCFTYLLKVVELDLFESVISFTSYNFCWSTDEMRKDLKGNQWSLTAKKSFLIKELKKSYYYVILRFYPLISTFFYLSAMYCRSTITKISIIWSIQIKKWLQIVFHVYLNLKDSFFIGPSPIKLP